ncbi:MAG: hypothetical protein K1Y36_13400 [Blastocatellia bacterium]|nr:hypothetical protein [Blastocatellia bacterium]
MARTIKRYANRKLYDVTERRYITLDEISELIQNNEEIQVIDKVTGEDITENVLSKVVVASANQPDGALPKNVLVSLIQRPGDAFMGYVRKTITTGFETVNHFERLSKTLRDLLRPDANGDTAATEELAPALRSAIESYVQESVQAHLAELKFAERSEVERLRQQVRSLERQLKALQPSQPEQLAEVVPVTTRKRVKRSA